MPDLLKRNIGVNFKNDFADILVWAPFAKSIDVKLKHNQKVIPLRQMEFGYWHSLSSDIKEGDMYKFVINGTEELPDPASLSQPGGVHDHSRVINLEKFPWTDTHWKNIPLSDYILYELHTGTFSSTGSFEGIEQKIPYLKELGITAIEIMPVAQFPGNRNWGYDGVYPFAVQHSYGGAEALMRLVNKCHQEGLAVVLDVVYNHMGPEGNYLGAYGPYFTEKYKTPWGGAINFDDAWCDGVRHYFIENVLMWFRDFHIDALRLDAVHAIKDFSAVHILEEIRTHVDELMKISGRVHYLIVELDLNDTRYIKPRENGGYGMHAQWIDEFHHALRVTAGGDRNGYYSDFSGLDHLAKAYSDAYVYDGQYSPHRKKRFGLKAENRPGEQFIVFSQNHDQVGNRMLGERSSQLMSFEMQKLLAAAVMISPFLPMLFMGEEWSEPNPFLYFVSHTDPQLIEAVRRGRKQEFAAFHATGEAPDPVSDQTFIQSKLSWNVLEQEPHQTMLEYYKALLQLRKTLPTLKYPDRKSISVHAEISKNSLVISRSHEDEEILALLNFSKEQQSINPVSDVKHWYKIFDSADPKWKGPAASPREFNAIDQPSVDVWHESILIYSNNNV